MNRATQRTPREPYALQLASSPNALRLLTRMLLAFAIATALALVFVPWQQNVEIGRAHV